MKGENIKTLSDLKFVLALIRDREDCPEHITELIDEIRYSRFLWEEGDQEF